MVKEFKMVASHSHDDFEDKVSALVNEGWALHTFSVTNGPYFVFYHTLIREVIPTPVVDPVKEEPQYSGSLLDKAKSLNRLAQHIHYPQHWDTVNYPTLEAALMEVLQTFTCTDPVHPDNKDAN